MRDLPEGFLGATSHDTRQHTNHDSGILIAFYRKHLKRTAEILLLTLGGLYLVSCALLGGSDKIPKAQGYALQAPAHWRAIGKDKADYAFDNGQGQTVTVLSSCDHRSHAPLEMLTKQLLIGARNVRQVVQEPTRWGTRDGLHTEVWVTFNGTKLYMDLFLLTVEDCVFDFSMVGREKSTAAAHRDFETYVASFDYGKD